MVKRKLIYFLIAFIVSGINKNASGIVQPVKGGSKFILYVVSDNIINFQQHVQAASRLTKFGSVQINVGTLADKAFHEIPQSGNPWAEYASNNASLSKFFPHAEIAPFIPASFVQKNRELLLAKVKLLRQYGMQGTIFANEPAYLPAAFFEAQSQLRGPRVDHPRRSTAACFSPCLSQQEMQEMYSDMMATMLKAAPEIKSYFFKTNDAGSGNCWTDWLYPGPNGPDHCKAESTGLRMKNLFDALQSGAAKAGTSLDVYLSPGSSNFTDAEKADIGRQLPANCYFDNRADFEAINTGSDIAFMYPVIGVNDILGYLKKIQNINAQKQQTIFINFTSFYNRGNEDIELETLLLNILADHLEQADTATPLQKLKEYCHKWGGESHGAKLYNAFIAMHEAFQFRRAYLSNLNTINWSVAARMINRPLVIAPQRLRPEEESYFLPYVFNVSMDEARMDYMDIQGGRWETIPDSVNSYVAKLNRVIKELEKVSGNNLLYKMANALKIHSSLVRSIGNFYAAQKMRDKNAAKLKEPRRPGKEPSWQGDGDYISFNNIMRDELDNTTALLKLLEKEGIKNLSLAADRKHEDPFLLGPDIISQLKKKQIVMINHWRDIDDYITPPFK